VSVRGKVDDRALRDLAVEHCGARSDPPEEPVELAIARMYRDVLTVPDVGRVDDFFALGGDSLATLELADEFAREFGVELELSVLLEHPTPAALAAWTRAAPRQRRHVFQASSGSDDLVPLVWFAGLGGAGVHNVVPGIRTLAGRTSYVVLPHGLEFRARPDRTIERIAARAVPELLALDPQARFILVGQSSGGAVAIEAAAQLAVLGREPPLVVLLDASGPNQPRARRLRMGLERDRVALQGKPLRWRYRQARLVMAEVHWSYWGRTAGWVRRTGDEQARAFRAVIHAALARYQGRRYRGHVVLLRATTPLPQYPDTRRSLGWDRFLTDLEIIEVPGTHNDLLSEHVDTTLAAMEEPFAAADRRTRRGDAR
jgi:thioesterase domain-containing protein/acyl carrier protein